MTKQTDDLRQPAMGDYDGHPQWNCQWPGCEFDTLDEAQWIEHIDPRTGAHRDPLGLPGANEPRRLLPDERAELEELRAEVQALRKLKADVEKTAPPKGDKAKGE